MDNCQTFRLFLALHNAQRIIDALESGELPPEKYRRTEAILRFMLSHLKACRAHDDVMLCEAECERHELMNWFNEYQIGYWETHERDIDEAAKNDPVMAVWCNHFSQFAAFQLQHAEHCAEHHGEYADLKAVDDLVQTSMAAVGQMAALHPEKFVTRDAKRKADLDNAIAELIAVRPKKDDGTEH